MNKIDRKNVNEVLSAYNSGSIANEDNKQNNPLLADSIQLSGGPEFVVQQNTIMKNFVPFDDETATE